MKVTLKDIAKDTGYSISTVSRALNGSDKLNTTTRRRIYQSAKKLNYPVYKSFNGDTVADTLTVSLVLTRFHIGEFYASFFYGFNAAACKHDISLSLVSLQNPFDQAIERIKKMSKNNDGLVIFAPEFSRAEYKKLREVLPDQYPVISNGLIENPVFNTVTFDGYSGGYWAAEHFEKKRYQSCGIIRGAFEAIEARYRLNGFRDYISQHDNMELTWDYQGDFSFKCGKKAFKEFQKLDKKPRAVFASNDNMGHAFMEEALVHGYSVPDDIAIVGYDDLPICKRHRPSISSIHTDYEKLGDLTMRKLKEVLSNPDQGQGLLSLVPVELKKRESS